MLIRITAKDGFYEFDDLEEIWTPVAECPEHYEISNMGRCRSITRLTKWGNQDVLIKGRILRPRHRKGLYSSYMFSVNNIHLTRPIHQLVADHFIPNPENKKMVNHKFGKKWDNRASEIEWATGSENCLHAMDMGLNNARKLTADNVRFIRASGMTDIELGNIFNVRKSNIWNIRNFKSWKHVV